MSVAQNKDEAFVIYVHHLIDVERPNVRLKLEGLDAEALYEVEGDGKTIALSGDVLMNAGIFIPRPARDFESRCYRLKRIDK